VAAAVVVAMDEVATDEDDDEVDEGEADVAATAAGSEAIAVSVGSA
jgi:hypothetical protein